MYTTHRDPHDLILVGIACYAIMPATIKSIRVVEGRKFTTPHYSDFNGVDTMYAQMHT